MFRERSAMSDLKSFQVVIEPFSSHAAVVSSTVSHESRWTRCGTSTTLTFLLFFFHTELQKGYKIALISLQFLLYNFSLAVKGLSWFIRCICVIQHWICDHSYQLIIDFWFITRFYWISHLHHDFSNLLHFWCCYDLSNGIKSINQIQYLQQDLSGSFSKNEKSSQK